MKISNILRQSILQLSKRSEPKPKTIYALSSGYARSGVAIIRVSGDYAKNAMSAMTNFGRKPEIKPRYMYYTPIKHPINEEIIDNGMTVWFPGPHSFTGEDTCEFHIHGGPAVISDVLQALAQMEGLRPAEAGEFSKRAFFNGKLDLTTAEGLADLLNAETSAQRKLALRQATGDLKKLYFGWREKLIKCLAHVEAYIDFSEEEAIEDNVMDNVNKELTTLRETIVQHLKDSRMGERLRNGLHVAIVGKPNVGKSSLLNRLCKRPAAIVTPVPGTTRDTLEVHIDIAGFPILLMDTAGIRHTDDIVEKEGVQRSRRKLSEADIVIAMLETEDFPSSRNVGHTELSESADHSTAVLETYLNNLFENFCFETASDMPEILILVNKIDKLHENAVFKVDKLIWRQKSLSICWISCLDERGMDEFLRKFTSLAELLCGRLALSSSSPLFTQQRHRHLVSLALSELDRYFQLRDSNLVIAADHLRRIIHHIGALTGQVTTEDILDCVFRDFCIGK